MELFRMSERMGKDEFEIALSWYLFLMSKGIPTMIVERKTCLEVWREGTCMFGHRELPKGAVSHAFRIPEEVVRTTEARAHIDNSNKVAGGGSTNKVVISFRE